MHLYDREIKDNHEIQNILLQGKYAVVALCRDNEPYLVTLNYGYDREKEAMYFHSALAGLKLDFLQAFGENSHNKADYYKQTV